MASMKAIIPPNMMIAFCMCAQCSGGGEDASVVEDAFGGDSDPDSTISVNQIHMISTYSSKTLNPNCTFLLGKHVHAHLSRSKKLPCYRQRDEWFRIIGDT
jgi:hypothetical protein